MATKKDTTKKSEAFVISQYFGFSDIEIPHVKKEDVDMAKKLRKYDPEYHDENLPPVEEHVALLRTISELGLHEKPMPIMHYYEGTPKGPHKKRRVKTGEKHLHLHIIGTPKSIAEAILIKTTQAILKEHGYKDTHVSICNVGDEESQKQFNKELTAYLRSKINDMNSNCRELFKKGSHSVITCGNLPGDIADETPDPVNFLSDSHCQHLGQVIDFMEKNGISYDINKNVLGNPHYSTDTVFTIVDSKTGEIVATGTRYNHLAKKLGFKKDLPSGSVHIKIGPKMKAKKHVKYADPKFYLIQIGNEAKNKCLKAIDMLREAGISVYHSLGRDKLSTQMQIAAKKDFSHILIVGHKEALENGALVRDVYNNEQEFVKLDDLPKYLKSIKK